MVIVHGYVGQSTTSGVGIPWYTQLLDKSDGNQDLILPKVFFSHGLYHMVTED